MINEIKDGIEVLKFNKPVMAAVANRPAAKKWGFIILAVPPVLNLILSSMLFPSGFGSLFTRVLFWPMVIPSIALTGAIFVMSYAAERIFASKHGHWPFFKVLAYASVFLWLSAVPFLLALTGLIDPSGLFDLIWLVGVVWMFVVGYHLFLEWGKLSNQNAVIILAIGVVAYLILQLVLGRVLVGNYYRMFY
ncbi:hypothetical protein HZA40_04185 [Candidatus Peregrinibacteria bacterium]|nr:hypothetical protein [Candidatus Peregrinibacteria bacterium]